MSRQRWAGLAGLTAALALYTAGADRFWESGLWPDLLFLTLVLFPATFALIWLWLRHRSTPPGEVFVWYVAAYGVFRFLVEFVRGNEVVWEGLIGEMVFAHFATIARCCRRG